jgi:hypothetical protein
MSAAVRPGLKPVHQGLPPFWDGRAAQPARSSSMGAGAQTPEELDALLEDACVTRDAAAATLLFGAGAVLAGTGTTTEARGTTRSR